MTGVVPAASSTEPDLLAVYEQHVIGLGLQRAQHGVRLRTARAFLERWPDLDRWMGRPTATRLRDLHQLQGWPLLSWCLVTQRLRPDLELLLAKPGGCGLPALWGQFHREEVARVTETGRMLGWSTNWTRQLAVLGLPILCLWTGKALAEVDDADFERILAEVETVTHVSPSARAHARTRLFGLSELCFQLGVTAVPRRKAGPVRRTPVEQAGDIGQPEIRREVVRYAQTISTTLAESSVYARVKALRVFLGWLADQHPTVRRLDQLTRTDHIEPFLVWDAARPMRGTNGCGRTISKTQFHHDIVDLRVFFEDIALWGWPSQPPGRLLFAADIPRMPDPLPRALPPEVDRTLMRHVAQLNDDFVRTGLLVLRATGMRIGELLDLELDCLVDFPAHGTWLKVPLGKLAAERMVPLDDDTIDVLDRWIELRGPQRPLPHPRDGRPTDFLFLEGGRRPTMWRLRRGLVRAAQSAGLTGPGRQTLKVTPHQLRHTYGTELINGGMSLQALMALLGHVSPEMTLRYAKLANPTIRAAYQDAIAKTRLGQRLPIAIVNRTPTVPDKVTWLRAEMLKTRLAHGLCARDVAAGPCPYANICEQCDNFVPDTDAADILRDQQADIGVLRDDATDRGWHDEAARHDRVIDALDSHLRRLEDTP